MAYVVKNVIPSYATIVNSQYILRRNLISRKHNGSVLLSLLICIATFQLSPFTFQLYTTKKGHPFKDVLFYKSGDANAGERWLRRREL